MYSRNFSDLADERLVNRGNKILNDLFSKSVRSVRQLCDDDASAKGCYRSLQNDRVSEQDIVRNMMHNCLQACRNKYAHNGTPYGFDHVKLWSRSGGFQSKQERRYQSLPIEENKHLFKHLFSLKRHISN